MSGTPKKPAWPPVGSCIAHRGAAGTIAENTIAAATGALRQGAGIVEVDLQRTADDELIIFHDSITTRTTNVAEVFPDRVDDLVGDFTLGELKKLDAGSWFSRRSRGATVPTLAEMLEAVTPHGTLFIELKGAERYPGIVDELVAELRRCVGDRLDGPDVPVAVQAKEVDLLRQVHDALPRVPVCLMTGIVEPVALESLAPLADWVSGYVPLGRELRPGYIERVHGYGIRVAPWTIDAPEAVTAATELGADAIITNYIPETAPLFRGEPGPLPRTPLRVVSADPDAEVFTVRNVGGEAVDTTGWATRNQLMVWQGLPARTLAPGESLAVPSGGEHYLDNYGENLALHDPDDAVVDLHAYRLKG